MGRIDGFPLSSWHLIRKSRQPAVLDQIQEWE